MTLFLAGTAATKIAIVNMLVHLVRNPELKAKLLAEVDEVTNTFKDSRDLQEKYELEVADEFEFLRQCFNESLRIEPPGLITNTSYFNSDVTLDNNVHIKAGQPFIFNIDAIHNDK